MATVKHLAKIKPSGEIKNIILGPAELPPEGLDENGDTILYIYEDLPDPALFMERNYYDFSVPALVLRPTKPNPFGYWTGASWAWDEESFLNYIRELRNEKLTKTDWTQVVDAPLTETEKLEAQTYRQALRDMTIPIQQNPQNYPTEASIPWPTPPSFLNIEI